MINKYRVDRHDNPKTVPVGMASIVYLGNSETKAMQAYEEAQPGLDPWNQPSLYHGVLLSVWSEQDRRYVPQFFKWAKP